MNGIVHEEDKIKIVETFPIKQVKKFWSYGVYVFTAVSRIGNDLWWMSTTHNYVSASWFKKILAPHG